MKSFLTISLILLSLSLHSNSEDTWRINKDHSEIFFKVPYLSLSSVSGRFTDFIGRISFTKNNAPKSLLLNIKAKSLFTGNKIRDGHLKSKDFFKANKYEKIIFKSNRVEQITENEYKIIGSLKIKDISKVISFNIKISKLVEDSWGYKNKFVTFKTILNRKDFGLTWNKSLKDSKYLLGDNINVWGKFQIQPLNTKTPAHKFMIPNTKLTSLRGKLIRGEIEQKDFDKEIEVFLPNNENRKEDILVKESVKSKVPPKKLTPLIKSPEKDKSTVWWVSYYIMGFIGFLATLTVCMQGKYFFMKLWPKKYNEVGVIGISSDLVAYAVAFIYVWAMWNLVYY